MGQDRIVFAWSRRTNVFTHWLPNIESTAGQRSPLFGTGSGQRLGWHGVPESPSLELPDRSRHGTSHQDPHHPG
jgi:hypothetical protein